METQLIWFSLTKIDHTLLLSVYVVEYHKLIYKKLNIKNKVGYFILFDETFLVRVS